LSQLWKRFGFGWGGLRTRPTRPAGRRKHARVLLTTGSRHRRRFV